MRIYTFSFEQKIPVTIETAWDFFSSPFNLARITPSLGFKIVSNLKTDQKMYPGILIAYTVAPLLGIKMNWLTEITHVSEHEYFIDEQRFGPFALWHHQHHFKEIDQGIEMKDMLTYAIPYSYIGRIANGIAVKSKIQKIFNYREKKIEEIFGVYKEL